MPRISSHPVHNRIDAVMGHIPRYWFDGIPRLAADAGVSQTALRRLIAGQSSPSFAMIWKIAKVLEKHLRLEIHPFDLISLDGSYRTDSACAVAGCQRNCLSPRAYLGKDQNPDQEEAQ